MENFKSFISEEVTRDKITILVLTNSKAKKPEIVTGMLLKACEELNLPCYTVVTTEAWISDNDIEKGTVAIKNHDGEEKDIEVETVSTVVFVSCCIASGIVFFIPMCAAKPFPEPHGITPSAASPTAFKIP